MNDDLDRSAGLDGLGASFDASTKPIITVDTEKYAAFLDEAEMTDAEKEKFLQALWEIIVSFVEFGFGVHPLQEVCGKDADGTFQGAQDSVNALCSDEPCKDKNNNELSP